MNENKEQSTNSWDNTIKDVALEAVESPKCNGSDAVRILSLLFERTEK